MVNKNGLPSIQSPKKWLAPASVHLWLQTIISAPVLQYSHSCLNKTFGVSTVSTAIVGSVRGVLYRTAPRRPISDSATNFVFQFQSPIPSRSVQSIVCIVRLFSAPLLLPPATTLVALVLLQHRTRPERERKRIAFLFLSLSPSFPPHSLPPFPLQRSSGTGREGGREARGRALPTRQRKQPRPRPICHLMTSFSARERCDAPSMTS